jgi:hypothetical protein
MPARIEEAQSRGVNCVDVCIAFDLWEDRPFVARLEGELHGRALSTYLFGPWNLQETLNLLSDGLRFRYLIDRASDTSMEFRPLHALVLRTR